MPKKMIPAPIAASPGVPPLSMHIVHAAVIRSLIMIPMILKAGRNITASFFINDLVPGSLTALKHVLPGNLTALKHVLWGSLAALKHVLPDGTVLSGII